MARAAADREKSRADELKKVADFQANMLAQVDPMRAGFQLKEDIIERFDAALVKTNVPAAERPARVKAFRDQWGKVNTTDAARALINRTILQPAVSAIDKQFKDQPVVAAALRQALSTLYLQLGLYDAALPLQEERTRDPPVRSRCGTSGHPDFHFQHGRIARQNEQAI